MKKACFFGLIAVIFLASCTKPWPYCGGKASIHVTKDPGDLPDHIVQVSASSNTLGVVIATIDISAKGSDVTLDRLPVTITVNGPTTQNVSDIINTARLEDEHGNTLDVESIPTASTELPDGSKIVTVVFQSLKEVIRETSSQKFVIKADINALNENFASGTYVVAELTQTNVQDIQAYDFNNNVLGPKQLMGSTTGSIITFILNGIQVTAVGTPGTVGGPMASFAPPGGVQIHGVVSFIIPFAVTALGTGNVYIPSVAVADTLGVVSNPTPSVGNFIQYSIESGTTLLSGTAIIAYLGTDGELPDQNGNYIVPPGQTKKFAVVGTYVPSKAGAYRAGLVNVNYSTDDFTFSMFTEGLNAVAFKTNTVAGN